MKFGGRFLAVGALVTAIDTAVVLTLAESTDLQLWFADLIAVATATFISYVLHRIITYENNPARRWYANLVHYLFGVSIAMAVDVAIFSIGSSGVARTASVLWLPKLLGISGAFIVRVLLYRRSMFATVRNDQAKPLDRGEAPGECRLTLVIPAYGEEAGIAQTIERVRVELAELVDDGGYELLIVDDGSTDDTAGAARRAGADTVIRVEPNRGKGFAVKTGVLAAKGRTIAFTDADLSYSPNQVLALMARIEEGWDVAVGSRKHTETRTLVAARRLREMGGRIINALTWAVLLGQYRDTQCGLKAFRSDAAKAVFARTQIDGFAFDVEVFHLVERYRFRLTEEPVEVVNSSRSTVNVVRDALRLVRDLFRVRYLGHSGAYEIEETELHAVHSAEA